MACTMRLGDRGGLKADLRITDEVLLCAEGYMELVSIKVRRGYSEQILKVIVDTHMGIESVAITQ
ncbi:MAG: hypothetical protein CSA26_11695 [Desulfobacterales bacterium]|nr:MAG: hypothetical protein CSA26_11695 [Desulfobacterales bacterium]